LSLTVVKVGGSFANHPALPALVAALVQGAGRTVVVPGGGPFADLVRQEQKPIGYGDAAAHRMALLAMAQFGYALASFSPVLAAAPTIAAIEASLAGGRLPVWLPLELLMGSPEIPETWDMTSDSVAAWLAGRLAAARLIFLKRAAPRTAQLSALVAAKSLDPLVPRFLAGSAMEAWICRPEDIPALGQALSAGEMIGRRIEVA
jgi:dihydroneopterin aldolase